MGKSLIFIAIFLSLSLGAWGKVSIVGVSTEIRVNSDSKTQPAKQAPGPTTQSHSSTAPKKEIVPISIAPSPIKTPQVIVPNTTDPAKIDMPKIGTPNVNLGKIKNQPYCSEEDIAVVGRTDVDRDNIVRTNIINFSTHEINNRYEICFDFGGTPLNITEPIEIDYNGDTGNKPLVISGLLLSADPSATFPLIRVSSASSKVIIRNSFLTGGKVGIELNGNNNKVIGGTIRGFTEAGIHVTGQGNQIINNKIIGLDKQGSCLEIEGAENIKVEKNTLSECNFGVLVKPDSGLKHSKDITIGSKTLKKYSSKKNRIHQNNFGVKAMLSEQVFVGYNQFWDNDSESGALADWEHFGLWVDQANSSLGAPVLKLAKAGEITNVLELDSVTGDSYIEVEGVGSRKGKIEFTLPKNQTMNVSNNHGMYQPYQPIFECPLDGSATVQCVVPQKIIDRYEGKLVIAILHDQDHGTSPVSPLPGKLEVPNISFGTSVDTIGNAGGEEVLVKEDGGAKLSGEELTASVTEVGGDHNLANLKDAVNRVARQRDKKQGGAGTTAEAQEVADPDGAISLPPPGSEFADNSDQNDEEGGAAWEEGSSDTPDEEGDKEAMAVGPDGTIQVKPGTQLIAPAKSEESSTPGCSLVATTSSSSLAGFLPYALLLFVFFLKRIAIHTRYR